MARPFRVGENFDMTLATLTIRKWPILTSMDQSRIVDWLEDQVKELRSRRAKIAGNYRARYIVTVDFNRGGGKKRG